MARLGDLLKISTDSYKRLEVVDYVDKYIVLKNKNINYVVSSDRRLKAGDVLFAAANIIGEGDTLICNQQNKDFVVTIKVLYIGFNVNSKSISKIKTIHNKEIKSNKPKKLKLKRSYNRAPWKASPTELKGPRMRVISIPMGGQKRY